MKEFLNTLLWMACAFNLGTAIFWQSMGQSQNSVIHLLMAIFLLQILQRTDPPRP